MNLSLIVPTFDRPEWISRLLRFLAPSKKQFKLVLLDSSTSDIVEQNRACAQSLGIDLTHRVYPREKPFKEKLLDGLRLIDTEYCVFCADDDLIIPEALRKSVQFLEQNSDYSGAHGLYFAYSGENGQYFVDDILYSQRGLDQDGSLARLACLFEDYQSNFYGVFRTGAQRHAFEAAVSQTSSLYFELMQSAHTAIQGKVARLPIIYAGRSRSESAGTREHWHPVDWIALDAQSYLNGYRDYLEALLGALFPGDPGSNNRDRQHAKQTLDLIHLRYSLDSIRSAGLRAAIDAQLARLPDAEVASAAFASAFGPTLPEGIRPGGPAWRLAISLVRRTATVMHRAKQLADRIGLRRIRETGSRRCMQGKCATVEFNNHVPDKLSAFDSKLDDAGLKAILDVLDAYIAAEVVD